MDEYKEKMVQTKQGARGNPWIEYMRVCAANYKAGQTQHHSAAGKQSEAPTTKPVQKRLVGKQTPAATADPQDKATPAPNVKPTVDAKTVRRLEKVAKAAGKARAAKVASSKSGRQ